MILIFMDIALVPTIMLTVAFFFILAHDLKAFVSILAKYTTRIGEQHKNEAGQLIYYTNLLRNKYVVRNTAFPTDEDVSKVLPKPIVTVTEASTIDMNQPSTSTQSQVQQVTKTLPHQPIKISMIQAFALDQDAYDYFYVRQIVLFQKHLSDTTDKLYDFYFTVVKICAAVGNLMIILVVLVTLYPTTIPFLNRLQVNGECAAMTVFFVLFFYCGEFLAECNLHLRMAAYNSGWYKCTNRTRRAVIIFMTRNQSMNYFTIFSIFRLEYDLMVRAFKGAYSFFNIVITMSASSKVG
uniref:Uncharacterized protein n=1 Tax=Cacopsylla melanoneura TaxID=428564 RepID=A0A8D8ZAE1_9HEMI